MADPTQPSAYREPETERKLTTPADRIKIISNRLATAAPVKRPVNIIEPPLMDPTIRKKRRSEHPLNVILGKRLEIIKSNKEKDKHLPVQCVLSDSDSESEDENGIKTPLEDTVKPPNVSTHLNLSISSDSSLEEGEVPDPIIPTTNNNSCNNKVASEDHSSDTDSVNSMNSKDSDNSGIDVKPSTSGTSVTRNVNKPKPNVNFNLEANEICEYIPETPIKRDIPVYHPSPIVKPERSSVSGIPRKDILFDLWLIIRKIDQDIGKDLEPP